MNNVTVTRVSFGFPTNVTEAVNIEDIESIKAKKYNNKNLHLKITIDKELKKNFNSENLALEIKEATGAEFVKISFVYENTNLVRSKEIAETQSLVEKFKKYATLNEISYKESVLSKIETLQDNMLINNAVPSNSFELESISLRGAIGIIEGQHKDEININFKEEFQPGIIALIGENGAGKSTLLENMHPYPQMLTRSGSLKDHFCLKDSHRIVVYRDSNGNGIKIIMLIDGVAKSVLSRYLVAYQEAGTDEWIPDGTLDGGYDSYKDFCENKFGSLSMFMRTSFSANKEIKNIPDLANATKSEKMTLFSTLAGTDYLGALSTQAKELANKESKIIDDIKGQLQGFDNIDLRLSEIKTTLEKNTNDLEKYKQLIDIDNQELELYTKEQEKYLAAAGAFDLIRTTLSEKRAKADDTGREISSINVSIQALNEDLNDIDLYKEQVSWYEQNSKKRDDLNKRQNTLENDKYKLSAEVDNIEASNREVQKQIDVLSNDIYKLSIEVESLEKSIPDTNGTCPVCGAPLSEHKKEELENERKIILNQITEKNNTKEQSSAKVKELKSKLVDLTDKRSELSKMDDEIISIINNITTINSYAEKIDIDKAKDIINNSTLKMDHYTEKLSKAENELKELNESIKEMEDKLQNIPTDYSDKIARLKRGIQDSQQNIATLTADNASMERELIQLDGYQDKVKEIKSQIKEHQQNEKDYTLIAKSFGTDGIQSLELDSAAPEISDITNSILRETYGDRFSISFDTQRNSKDGKRKIDDFIINVFDSRSGRTKKIDVLSGGESIWIKQSLYYAFSVIRARRTGFCFKTRFLDEADGALDSESRVKYLKMIEMAHNMCNATQTILITHSPEIKEIIEQKIEF